MAAPVLNAMADFSFMDTSRQGPRLPHNPSNDAESKIVLVAPSAPGLNVGSTPTTGPNKGTTILPNNVIPFNLVNPPLKPVVNWGDIGDTSLLSQLLNCALGSNTITISTCIAPGSTKDTEVMDPVCGGVLYTAYTGPNGYTVKTATQPSITVYQRESRPVLRRQNIPLPASRLHRQPRRFSNAVHIARISFDTTPLLHQKYYFLSYPSTAV